ncbi:fimbrial protein [Providencia rettgeri]|nr:fimbrial protein [Providencia rettgeri]ELL9156002.1 fimbrial protein [Providencia rettgeri]ELR5153083.1 fimbrial protein [Providencia rettgeri]
MLFIFFSQVEALTLGVGLKGNLIVTKPECILNNNQREVIHFGDILLPRINGSEYKKNVPMKLSCQGLVKNAIKITLVGDSVSFNNEGALATSNSKLGLIFYVNNIKKPINQAIDVTYTVFPSLDVAPIKDSKANFSNTDGGLFTALATLKIEYQ